MRRDLWDRHGGNIVTRWKEMYSERVFRRQQKKTILVRDHHFSAAVLLEMGVSNIDTRVAQGFV